MRWTTDLCANVILTHARRPEDHYPRRGDEWPQGFQPGAFEFRTVKPIRAMSIIDSGPTMETCRIHYGRRVRNRNGTFSVIYCSQPGESLGSDLLSRQVHIGQRYIQRDQDPNGKVEKGTGAYFGAYHTPYWTELLFHSHGWVCGSQVG